MTQPIEKQVEDLNANIKRIGDEIKPLAEQALKEAKQAGEVHAETKQQVDDALLKFGEMQATIQELAQKMAAQSDPQEPQAPKSAGQLVAEKLAEDGVNASFR